MKLAAVVIFVLVCAALNMPLNGVVNCAVTINAFLGYRHYPCLVDVTGGDNVRVRPNDGTAISLDDSLCDRRAASVTMIVSEILGRNAPCVVEAEFYIAAISARSRPPLTTGIT